MKKLLLYIQGMSTGKNVLAFLVPALMVYGVMLLYTIPTIMEYAPGMVLFDLSPTGYTYEYSQKLLLTLGDEGRDFYLYTQLPLDFVYPALFAVSCSLLLSWLLSKSQTKDSKLYYLCFIPLLAGLFDYFENICLLHSLSSYPDISESHIAISSVMTLLKSGITTAFFVALFFGWGLYLKEKYGAKHKV